MLKKIFYILILLFSFSSFSQINTNNEVKMEINEAEIDSILNDTILLQEVQIIHEKLDPEAKKRFLILQNRVYRVYPYAKIAAERLTTLNANMNKLKTNKEKKKYFKIVENYMENEFKAQLKKLSRKQGQILVKLINRQTGFTTFELIKDYKSGWKAFWSNNTAKLFDINLKTKYEPFKENEDFLIETILQRAFNNGRLIEQKSYNEIDFDELTTFWEQKAMEINLKKK
jgi:hypothetical protein